LSIYLGLIDPDCFFCFIVLGGECKKKDKIIRAIYMHIWKGQVVVLTNECSPSTLWKIDYRMLLMLRDTSDVEKMKMKLENIDEKN